MLRVAIGTFLLGSNATRADENLAARVVIVANRAQTDSLQLARYYAEQRRVPPENILAFAMPDAETISWPEFVQSVWQPLEDELVRRGWIDAVGSNLKDPAGRKKYAVNGHRISYLVVCRGVPLRINEDVSIPLPPEVAAIGAAFRTNQAAVDSELALLALPNLPPAGFVRNPFFQNDHSTQLQRMQVIKVSRLDGPSYESARGLIDRARQAECEGLAGRAYVDIGGIHPEGDRWLEETATQLEQAGFDLTVDRARASFSAGDRMDAPALYFGWYETNLNGPFALPGFFFPPGAVAMHIHSFSAHTLRSTTEGWCGPLVARGVTATVGNVFEPYLQLSHHPELLARALLRGDRFGDAAAYACPVFSWQAIAIGDPLYQPFARPLTEPTQRPITEWTQYAVMRQARVLEREQKFSEAITRLHQVPAASGRLAWQWQLAMDLEASGRRAEGVVQLETATKTMTLRPDEWALAALVATWLERAAPGKGFPLYEKLLQVDLPETLRVAWLEAATASALRARNYRQAETWQDELTAKGASSDGAK
jgi:uncharacterized protein (TIGR03790 family)